MDFKRKYRIKPAFWGVLESNKKEGVGHRAGIQFQRIKKLHNHNITVDEYIRLCQAMALNPIKLLERHNFSSGKAKLPPKIGHKHSHGIEKEKYHRPTKKGHNYNDNN